MIQNFADYLVCDLLGIDSATALGKAINFFFYDSIKILFLLFCITAIMGIVNAYLPISKLRKFLESGKLRGFQYVFAAIFGAISPFCTCSSIPLFIGFLKGGISLGVTFSFLIASPLINEVAIAVFIATFGWKVTLVYLFSGLILATIAGFILGKMNLEKYLTTWILQAIKTSQEMENKEAKIPFFKRLPSILKESTNIMMSVLPYVLLGIAVGAAIHGYVPEGFFEKYLASNNLFAVPLAVILAVPMYANAAGIVPVIEVFVAKGVPLGTALAFMMAVVGLSLPEAILLKKIMTTKLILIFFATISISIIALGYFFNILF